MRRGIIHSQSLLHAILIIEEAAADVICPSDIFYRAFSELHPFERLIVRCELTPEAREWLDVVWPTFFNCVNN